MKKTTRVVAIIVAAGALAAAAVGSAALQKAHEDNEFSYPWESAGSSDGQISSNSGSSDVGTSSSAQGGIGTTVKTNGVVLAALSTSTDGSGNQVRVFSYAVTPSDATDQTVSLSLAWTDPAVGEAVSAYLRSALDLANKRITITMLRSFSHQATLTIASNSDQTKTASVAIDCLQRFGGWKAYSDVGPIAAEALFQASLPSLSWDGDVSAWNAAHYPSIVARHGLPDASAANVASLGKGTTESYSKAVEFSYGMKLGAAGPFKWFRVASSDDGSSSTTDLGSDASFPAVDLSAYCSAGATLTISQFQQTVQSAINGMGAQAKAKLVPAASQGDAGMRGYYTIGLSCATSLVCSCSDGQTASYPMTLSLGESAAEFSF